MALHRKARSPAMNQPAIVRPPPGGPLKSLRDVRGVPVSTTSAGALAHRERATELAASYLVDPLAEIEQALADDPDFVMGHCLKGSLLIMSTEQAALPALRDCLLALDRLGPRANDRERGHAAAMRAWCAGEFARAI